MNRSLIRAWSLCVGLFIVLAYGQPRHACAEIEPLPSEDAIIGAVLESLWEGRGYTVVAPETSLDFLVYEKSSERVRDYLVKRLKIEGQDLQPLLDLLFAVNKTSIRLPLVSAKEKGYIIDHNGEYSRYFDSINGGGWDLWHEEHPDARGYTKVSRPIFDPQTGIILIYVGTQQHYLSGAGYVIVFKYEAGRLRELTRTMVWVS